MYDFHAFFVYQKTQLMPVFVRVIQLSSTWLSESKENRTFLNQKLIVGS